MCLGLKHWLTKLNMPEEVQKCMICSSKDYQLTSCTILSNHLLQLPMTPWKKGSNPWPRGKQSSMGCWDNELEEEDLAEVMPTSESTTTNNDAPSHKVIGGDHPEDREQEDDPNIIQPMPLLQWITCLSPWTCLGAVPQITGEDEVDNKETGDNEDPHKDELPKAQETILTMHALTVVRSDISPGIAPKDEGQRLNQI